MLLKKIFNQKTQPIPAKSDGLHLLFAKYEPFTMVPLPEFLLNMQLAERTIQVEGSVVECGVWKGGMIAAMAELLGPAKNYYLYDSFEGLPPAKEIDGDAAQQWQENITGKYYYNNCTASQADAEIAIKSTPVPFSRFHIHAGWFSQTMTDGRMPDSISLLRLDADWYDSTVQCLKALFHLVVPGGIVIIDDYYTWDGCSKAVHDFLSSYQRPERVQQLDNVLAFIQKC